MLLKKLSRILLEIRELQPATSEASRGVHPWDDHETVGVQFGILHIVAVVAIDVVTVVARVVNANNAVERCTNAAVYCFQHV
jgi:hypothetical protein